MHEQSIVEALLKLVLESAEKSQATKIYRIYLVIGDLSGVIDEAVDLYFNFLSKNTVAAGATLFFKHNPAQLRCRKCNKIFIAENLDFHCPDCKEQQVEIVSGRELYVESMEVQ